MHNRAAAPRTTFSIDIFSTNHSNVSKSFRQRRISIAGLNCALDECKVHTCTRTNGRPRVCCTHIDYLYMSRHVFFHPSNRKTRLESSDIETFSTPNRISTLSPREVSRNESPTPRHHIAVALFHRVLVIGRLCLPILRITSVVFFVAGQRGASSKSFPYHIRHCLLSRPFYSVLVGQVVGAAGCCGSQRFRDDLFGGFFFGSDARCEFSAVFPVDRRYLYFVWPFWTIGVVNFFSCRLILNVRYEWFVVRFFFRIGTFTIVAGCFELFVRFLFKFLIDTFHT